MAEPKVYNTRLCEKMSTLLAKILQFFTAVICKDLGIGYLNPAYIGDEKFCSALDELNLVLVDTGYGSFTPRKRDEGRWIAEKRFGEKVFQVTVGQPNDVTSESLDDAAVRIYENADKKMSAEEWGKDDLA